MEFNVQRIGDYWISGFRNVRHADVFIYPLILLLTGYQVALRAKLGRAAAACCVALVAAAAWQSVSAASKTRVAFADGRAVCRFLSTAPPSTIYLDDTLNIRCQNLNAAAARTWTIRPLPPGGPQRADALAAAGAGYVVTGGGREPIYGGVTIVPRPRAARGPGGAGGRAPGAGRPGVAARAAAHLAAARAERSPDGVRELRLQLPPVRRAART